MTLFSNSLIAANGQLILAVVLAVAGFFLLLPRPRGRLVAGGIAALLGSIAVFGAWLHQSFGNPTPDIIGSILFTAFASGALGFGAVVVVQRNPARGAIAFAFVILSTCGLFLMLAAPFLMAATIIVYAGAIIVTFLFVLMLSHADGPSDENDRSREPLLGSLAGFAFAGLILFTLFLSHEQKDAKLPAPVLTAEERAKLNDVAKRLGALADRLEGENRPSNVELASELVAIEEELNRLIAIPPIRDLNQGHLIDGPNSSHVGTIPSRLTIRFDTQLKGGEQWIAVSDPHAESTYNRVITLAESSLRAFRRLENHPPLASDRNRHEAIDELRSLRNEVRILAGSGELPARNVSTIGVTLYSEHLLEVELAGTLLLIATIGAIAIAQRKGAKS